MMLRYAETDVTGKFMNSQDRALSYVIQIKHYKKMSFEISEGLG